MISVITISLLILALLLLVPIVMLSLECAAALVPNSLTVERLVQPAIDTPETLSCVPLTDQAHPSAHSKYPASTCQKPRVAVLVPAHNEALGIQSTLETLKPQINPGDQLIVIADNCSDETASLSRALGATVLERHDRQQRGKGYALDCGRQFLQHDPPDVVVVIDADCRVSPGTLAQATPLAHTAGRPVQVTNLLYPPSNPSPTAQLSAFAFKVHTFVRPSGLARLGLPFNLHGTGMVFPWQVFRQVPLASSNIVEDMQLSLDLAILGHFPLFCAAGQVTGVLPDQVKAAEGQRTRWEHGHIRTLLTQSPRLLQAALRQAQPKLLALTLDLCVPPLSLLVLLWLVPTLLALPWALLFGQWQPALLLWAEGLMLLASILAVWLKFGRQELPLTTLLSVPFYVLWKVPIYLSFLLRPQSAWVRTSRE